MKMLKIIPLITILFGLNFSAPVMADDHAAANHASDTHAVEGEGADAHPVGDKTLLDDTNHAKKDCDCKKENCEKCKSAKGKKHCKNCDKAKPKPKKP